MNIVLSGMMGSGKTTVAQALSKLYGLKCVDVDGEIVSRYGTIDNIFQKFGEECFREIECLTVRQICSRVDGAVISLGGGCVLRNENVINLKKNGRIIYLRTRPETVIERLQGDSTRPLLQGDLQKRVHEILAARANVYESTADVIIDTDGLTPDEIAKIIRENNL